MINKILEKERSMMMKIGITMLVGVPFIITLLPQFNLLRALVGSITMGWGVGTFIGKLWFQNK
jgi:hypothetical protein